jgi:hypothetical protein
MGTQTKKSPGGLPTNTNADIRPQPLGPVSLEFDPSQMTLVIFIRVGGGGGGGV